MQEKVPKAVLLVFMLPKFLTNQAVFQLLIKVLRLLTSNGKLQTSMVIVQLQTTKSFGIKVLETELLLYSNSQQVELITFISNLT